MNLSIKTLVLIILLTCLILVLNFCKNEEKEVTPPVVTTVSVSGINQTDALSGGNITSDGGASVTSRGVCWNIAENPTLACSKTSDGSGTGSFSSKITLLTPGTKYYVKAYAVNSAGTSYGNQVSFTSSPILLATLTTSDVTSITSSTAVAGGEITYDGGGQITERGVCWSTSENPTISDNKTTDGSGTGSFTSNMTDLNAYTTYYVRSYATNSAGDAYGDQKSFTTARKVTCTAGCSAMSWGISGENFGAIQYSNWVCSYTYVGSSYIKSCEGTWTFLQSGNSYYIKVTYDWPACSITVDVTGVGTCSDKVGDDKSLKKCNCEDDPSVIEVFEPIDSK
jgi:hypothetical protein